MLNIIEECTSDTETEIDLTEVRTQNNTTSSQEDTITMRQISAHDEIYEEDNVPGR